MTDYSLVLLEDARTHDWANLALYTCLITYFFSKRIDKCVQNRFADVYTTMSVMSLCFSALARACQSNK